MKQILFLIADGVQDEEFATPLETLKEDGHKVDIAAPAKGEIRGKKGGKFDAHLSLQEANKRGTDNYDMLVLPGGKGPEKLMREEAAIEIIGGFQKAKKPIAAICHGTLLLARAVDVQHRKMTSPEGLSEEIRGGGGIWQDREVVVDGNFITSRTPDDIPAFVREIKNALTG